MQRTGEAGARGIVDADMPRQCQPGLLQLLPFFSWNWLVKLTARLGVMSPIPAHSISSSKEDNERLSPALQGLRKSESLAIYAILSAFAAVLALTTLRHEIYLDEAQAWLIARDSRGLFDLFHILSYEAHPALWYVVLFLPAHASSNMELIRVINFALAAGTAWLILSWRSQPVLIRTLLVFGITIFFVMGVLARSYMLGGFLLIAAARCLLVRRPRHWLAMSLLALAINTHFFAIPVVVCIFVWFYWFGANPSWAAATARLKEPRFRASAAVLGLALVTCFLTIHPAADVSTHYLIPGKGWVDYLVLAIGRIWHYFVPFSPGISAPRIGHSGMTLSEWTDALLTIACWLLAIAVLPTRRSRWFMISVSLLWSAAVIVTVHIPNQTHCSFLVVAYVIALNSGMGDAGDHSWLPSFAAQPMLLIILAMQISVCLVYCAEEWQKPFSGTKATAIWLENAGLSHRPLVIQPEIAAPALIGYLGIKSAYLPSCSCNHSYVIYRQGWDRERQVTRTEMNALQSLFGVSPVLISQWRLGSADLQNLGLQLLYTSPHGWAWDNENVYVYGTAGELTTKKSGAIQ